MSWPAKPAVASRLYRESTRRAERFVASLPPERAVSLDYEDLVDNPRPALARITELIGNDGDYDNRVWIDAAAAISRRRPSKVANLSPDIAARLDDYVNDVGCSS